MYYEDYITDRAEEAFNFEEAQITLYDEDHEEVDTGLSGGFTGRLFDGMMREMTAYLYERWNEISKGKSIEVVFDSDNVSEIYITARGLEAPNVIVEYNELPDWFKMENADLREFYWHPNPALSGEWSAAYFQPREA